MEAIAFPMRQDLVVCSAVLQWAADPHALLDKMTRCLAPGGVLAIATFGPGNFQETRRLTGCSLRYLSLEELRTSLAAHVELLECHEEIRTLFFTSAMGVLKHLKRTGVNGLQTPAWSPRAVRDFCRRYDTHFGDGTRVPLTFHPIIAVARRRVNSHGTWHT